MRACLTLEKGKASPIAAFIVFMVIGRLMSGVHWITDMIGGALFSAGAVTTYFSICNILK